LTLLHKNKEKQFQSKMKKYLFLMICGFLFQEPLFADQKSITTSDVALLESVKLDQLIQCLDAYAVKRWVFLQGVARLPSHERLEVSENLSRMAIKTPNHAERGLLLFLSRKIQKPLLDQGVSVIKGVTKTLPGSAQSTPQTKEIAVPASNPKDLTPILQAVQDLAPALHTFEMQCAPLQKKQKKAILKALKQEIKRTHHKNKPYYKELKSVMYYAADVADRHLPYRIVKKIKGIGSVVMKPVHAIVVKPVGSICKLPANLLAPVLKSADSKAAPVNPVASIQAPVAVEKVPEVTIEIKHHN